MDKKTSIQITEEVWRKLHSEKKIGDSFDDVIRRYLNLEAVNKNS